MPFYQLPPASKKTKRRRGAAAPLHFEQGFPTSHHRLYGSAQWKKLRVQFIAQFGSTCCDPNHDPKFPRATDVELDHIVEVSDDPARAFDPTNLILRCRKCHRRKTVAVAKERMQQDALRHNIAREHANGQIAPLKPIRPAHLGPFKRMDAQPPGDDEKDQ